MATCQFRDIVHRRWKRVSSEGLKNFELVLSRDYENLMRKLNKLDIKVITGEHRIVRKDPADGQVYDVVDITVEC